MVSLLQEMFAFHLFLISDVVLCILQPSLQNTLSLSLSLSHSLSLSLSLSHSLSLTLSLSLSLSLTLSLSHSLSLSLSLSHSLSLSLSLSLQCLMMEMNGLSRDLLSASREDATSIRVR